MNTDTEQTLRTKFQAEVDVLPWSELIRHYAFGRLYVARGPLELVDAAIILKNDEAEKLRTEMEASRFGVPTDDEVRTWNAANNPFEVLIVSPFVVAKPQTMPAFLH